MNDLQKSIIRTLEYFRIFRYAATAGEIHTFLPVKCTKSTLQTELVKIVKQGRIVVINSECFDSPRYTVGEYRTVDSRRQTVAGSPEPVALPSSRVRRASGSPINSAEMAGKIENSKRKIAKIKRFLKILSMFPQIRLAGLSGSVAMQNAEDHDDIDLFIITAENRMWTARFIGLALSHIMGIRRKRNETSVNNKVCLNLFFDEQDLVLPENKHTVYGAHEVLQMKPVINKEGTYERFLKANRWVKDIFPNTNISKKIPLLLKEGYPKPPLTWRRVGWLLNFFERILKQIQLSRIRKHQTSERITDTQLWFFPDDFEKRLK